MKLEMTRTVHAYVHRAILLLVVALAVGVAAAQAGSGTAATPAESGLSCGVVDVRPDLLRYYSELCGAFSVALNLPAHEVYATDSDRVLRALLAGSVDIALGLLWEGARDAPIRHGPVVLIEPQARYGIAARQGDDELLETVSWLFYALVEAEALGIGRAAARSDLDSVPDSTARRFRTYQERLTDQLDLAPDALLRMLAWTGHHGDLYDEAFGEPSEVNRPVEFGGQLYAPPVGGP